METEMVKHYADDAEPSKVFASGAKSSVEKPRYDLIPEIALALLAERYGYGAAKHGERNYLKGAGEEPYIRDRCNHLFEHVVRFTATRSRADLAAILCNAAMLAELGAFTDGDT
jgi:hypothetical protein